MPTEREMSDHKDRLAKPMVYDREATMTYVTTAKMPGTDSVFVRLAREYTNGNVGAQMFTELSAEGAREMAALLIAAADLAQPIESSK